MIIHIFGCPNSGKTTLRGKLKDLHPEFGSYCIDDFRREYGDGTLPKELVAQDMYSIKVRKTENGIFECSGAGRCAELSLKVDRDDQFIVVLLAPVTLCWKRIRDGKYDGIPFPFEVSDEDMIDHIDRFLGSEGFRMMTSGIPLMYIDTLSNSLDYQVALVEKFTGLSSKQD